MGCKNHVGTFAEIWFLYPIPLKSEQINRNSMSPHTCTCPNHKQGQCISQNTDASYQSKHSNCLCSVGIWSHQSLVHNICSWSFIWRNKRWSQIHRPKVGCMNMSHTQATNFHVTMLCNMSLVVRLHRMIQYKHRRG